MPTGQWDFTLRGADGDQKISNAEFHECEIKRGKADAEFDSSRNPCNLLQTIRIESSERDGENVWDREGQFMLNRVKYCRSV
jgi:hypothetical protein